MEDKGTIHVFGRLYNIWADSTARDKDGWPETVGVPLKNIIDDVKKTSKKNKIPFKKACWKAFDKGDPVLNISKTCEQKDVSHHYTLTQQGNIYWKETDGKRWKKIKKDGCPQGMKNIQGICFDEEL